jgi:hypothetical protein
MFLTWLIALGVVSLPWPQSATPTSSSASDVPRLVESPYAEIALLPVDPIAPGRPFTLDIEVRPKPGIHIYAPGQPDYRPLALTLAPQREVTVGKPTLPPGEILEFEPTGERLLVYSRPVRMKQRLGAGRTIPGGELKVRGSLSYQACDDKVCYRPVSVPLEWTVPVRR